MDRSTALEKLRQIVGAPGIVSDAVMAEKYLVDERRLYSGKAALIVRPETRDEIAAILKVCNDAGLGVVPQGGNTGYCGGATPMDGRSQILLSLERLNAIRHVDPIGFTATVEAGAILRDVQQAAEKAGMLFPLSMGSEGSCQIGGNLATNAGGLAVLRYGTARELVLGLEVVLSDGTVMNDLKGLRKDNTGYDLKSVFLGSEGTLGVITAAVLKLFPRPSVRETAWLAVPDCAAACELLGVARRISGDAVTSFEYVSALSVDLVLRYIEGATNPLETIYEHNALIEFSGSQAAHMRSVVEAVFEEGMTSGLIVDGVIAESGPQQDQLWRLRESIPEAEKHAGGAIKHDVSVDISKIASFIELARPRIMSTPAPRVSVFGHIGDGNLHYNLLAPEGEEPDAFKKRFEVPLTDAVHGLAAQLGGSFSAEHGVGQLKRETLAQYKDGGSLDLMRRMKRALDPSGTMNPGKII